MPDDAEAEADLHEIVTSGMLINLCFNGGSKILLAFSKFNHYSFEVVIRSSLVKW